MPEETHGGSAALAGVADGSRFAPVRRLVQLMAFDYSSPAELFMPKRKGRVRRSANGYRRFATAAKGYSLRS
jgi:hypothetical protein